jgi:hypothetical protein
MASNNLGSYTYLCQCDARKLSASQREVNSIQIDMFATIKRGVF